ncbi:unannotated protein [freshwater metagenome]|uniref:Unannotated protein n=1 Tax=freshwater metagenome TaxID=449393 RepID=A0A6J6XKF4_9ZZZZ
MHAGLFTERDEFVGCCPTARNGFALAIAVRRAVGKREPKRAGANCGSQLGAHGLYLSGIGGAANGFAAHHVTTDRAVAHEEPCVHRDVALKATQIVGEGFPAPVGAVFERSQRHALDLGHHLAQIVGITRNQRRQREATVATDDCGDAMVARWACSGIPQQLSVVVRVRIDDARSNNEASGIEHFGS